MTMRTTMRILSVVLLVTGSALISAAPVVWWGKAMVWTGALWMAGDLVAAAWREWRSVNWLAMKREQVAAFGEWLLEAMNATNARSQAAAQTPLQQQMRAFDKNKGEIGIRYGIDSSEIQAAKNRYTAAGLAAIQQANAKSAREAQDARSRMDEAEAAAYREATMVARYERYGIDSPEVAAKAADCKSVTPETPEVRVLPRQPDEEPDDDAELVVVHIVPRGASSVPAYCGLSDPQYATILWDESSCLNCVKAFHKEAP